MFIRHLFSKKNIRNDLESTELESEVIENVLAKAEEDKSFKFCHKNEKEGFAALLFAYIVT